MPQLAITAFGAPSVASHGEPIAVDTRKAIAMLVYLAVERRAHTRDTLAALLWPEYDQAHARATLRRTLSALVHALPPNMLVVSHDTIAVADDADLRFDIETFRRLLLQSQQHRHTEAEVCADCLAQLRQATELYQGDFLAGFALRDSEPFEDWQAAQRDALRRDLAAALERITRLLTAQHAYAEALPYARRWLELDPLHETAHRHVMRLYEWSGQHAAALRQYRLCLQTLDRELGIAPLDATTQLYEAIRQHRAPPPPPNTQRASAPSHSPDDRVAAAPTSAASSSPASVLPAPFVGRAQEWAAALAAYQQAGASGHLLAVEGEAGIGKTRLVEQLVAYARERGATVVTTRCYQGEETLAYAPFAAAIHSALSQPDVRQRLALLPDHWLSVVARFAPEVAAIRPGVQVAPPLDGPGAQSRFFEGLRQALISALSATAQPGVLFLDDLHWADAASLALVAYLARRLPETRICLVVAWRGAELASQHPLRQWLAEARRSGVLTHLRLERLPESAVQEWVATSLPATAESPPGELATHIHQETEGLPFFVAEYILALAQGTLDTHAQLWTVPGGIRDLLQSRLRLLSDEARQVLSAAAVLGRTFDFVTVRESSGRSEEETVAALETLTAYGLLTELAGTGLAGPAYDFTHQKLRELTYQETSLARRRLLHHRAAEALVALGRRNRPAEGLAAGQIAHHYLAAGDQRAAAQYFRLAAERARSLYANEEALGDFARALALGHPDAGALHEAIGDLQVLLGRYADALASFKNAASAGDDAEVDTLVRLDQKLSKVHARRGNWDAAQSYLEAALAQLGTREDPMVRAHIFAEWSLIARGRGAAGEARTLAARALDDATAAESPRALAEAHNLLGVLASDQREYATSIDHLQQSLELAVRADDSHARAAALTNLALALGRAGDAKRALRLAEEALALCAVQGDRHHQAALHNNIADLLHSTGRSDEAIPHLKQAVAILAEIGVESGAVQPEIWKLAEW